MNELERHFELISNRERKCLSGQPNENLRAPEPIKKSNDNNLNMPLITKHDKRLIDRVIGEPLNKLTREKPELFEKGGGLSINKLDTLRSSYNAFITSGNLDKVLKEQLEDEGYRVQA